MKIAVLGYGVVGAGVVELLHKNESGISKRANEKIEIKYILDIRDFPDSPYHSLFIKDFEKILFDEEIEVVVEVIGGLNPAYSFVKRSLLAGKSVVTSNKELVATYGDELLKIAKDNNLNFLFEASVGGGIPIIRPINQCLAANEITGIIGILNGTTNFILTKMIKDGYVFDKALQEAQSLGYAERDPSADIDGIDACRKIAILGSLAFGSHIDPNKIQTEGIRHIDLKDVNIVKEAGFVVKLIGVARMQQNGRLYTIVAPFLISNDSPLSNVDDVFNGILVEGDAIGETMFYGKGAGKLPTASAVVADVIDCAKHKNARKYLFWSNEKDNFLCDFKEMESSFYLRLENKNNLLSLLKDEFKDVDVLKEDEELCVILPKRKEYDVENIVKEMCEKTQSNCISKLRILK